MQKNMKMQDGQGRILVSGALDPRKMISPKILKTSARVQLNYPSATPTSPNNRAWEIPKENIIKDHQQKLSQQSTLTVVGTGPADEETYT